MNHHTQHDPGRDPDDPACLGIDIGRVIIGPVDDDGHADTSFLAGTPDQAMATPPAVDAFATIARLADAFDGQVWLVSKCGPRVQDKTRRWLAHWRFWETTGIPPDQVRFCLERRDKAQHCAELGVTHFVDDRVDVLRHLVGLVSDLYLFGADWRHRPVPDWTTPIYTWADAEAVILGGRRQRPPRHRSRDEHA
jgi:hypothetical protein